MATSSPFDRRAFLKAAGSVVGAMAGGEYVPAFGQVASPFVRKDILTLDPNGPEVLALRAGVAVMRNRGGGDPTSWSFQANIHGMLVATQNDLWQQCQHGHWWFFPWHRMYLFCFERILRKAIQESGTALPAGFALPYWNYSDMDSARTLPAAFRARTCQMMPGGPQVPNPLFEMKRRSDINAGTNAKPLDADTVSYSDAFALSQFVSSNAGLDGFGGQMTSVPLHFPQLNHGALEHSPHDLVHDGIGGLMGDPRTAANDPIFWLHHCNIDRLWNRWLAKAGNTNPDVTATWGVQPFSFADETGATVTRSVYQFLEYVTGNLIDYTYDDAPAVQIARVAAPTAPPGRERANVHGAGGPQAMAPVLRKRIRLASFPPPLALTGKPTVVKIKVPDAHQPTLAAAAEAGAAVTHGLYLEIGGIDLTTLPNSGYYDVYVNLPPAETPSHKSGSFVGSLSTFALRQQLHMVNRTGTEGGAFSFPLTPVLRRLKKANNWSASELSVTFVPRELPPDEAADNARLTFRYVGVHAEDEPHPAQKP